MFSDLKFAFRQFRQTPFLSAVIILSLAIGIGANTVVFSWLKSAVFAPLPGVAAPVLLLETKDDTGNYVSTSWLEYRDLREMLPSFEAVAAQRMRTFHLGDSEREARAFGQLVSANFFTMLGVRPEVGRFFRPEEVASAGSAPVVVISHDFWRGYFEGAPDVVGRLLKLNGRTLTVIGVAPAGFQGGMNNLSFDLWAPATMAAELIPASSELSQRSNRAYLMLARLRPGVTAAQARGELNAAAQRLKQDFPDTNRGLGYALLPLWCSPRGGQAIVASLGVLQLFATLILVVVCANTANLLLARASVRRGEIGVRLAIGAGPGRIIRQLLGEAVVLALIAAAGGFLCALWGIDALVAIPLHGSLPLRIAPELDWMSLLFAASLGATCGVAFGLAPALQLARGDVQHALRGGRGMSGGRSRMRDLLVGLEVAVALVVLVLAGLFLKSFHNSLGARPGFDADRVLLVSLDLGSRGYNGQTGGALLDDLLQRLNELPVVEHAAAANAFPLDFRGISTGVISVEGQPFDPDRKILYYNVTAGYFASMGIPLVAGTDLAARPRSHLPPDAVINEEMARRYWPGQSAVGHRFEVSGTTYVVAGVARGPKLERLNEPPKPAAWLTMRGLFVSYPYLHVRVAQGDPRAQISAIRGVIRKLDADLPALDAHTLASHVDNNLFMQRVPARMLAVLGPLALALAAVGLYAVLAYAVAQRTQEIGVRLTLGATPAGIMGLMLWQQLRIVLLSAAGGWGLALLLGWFLRDLFVGVPFGDPLIYTGVPLLLLAVAFLACWIPARRATKVDPMVALRAE